MRSGARARRLLSCAGALLAVLAWYPAALAATCDRPVYLTFDTGHMGVAPLVADVLARHRVPVTFFVANERTRTGGSSLDDEWAPWWRQRAAEGHAFASHTWNHVVWRADRGDAFEVRATAGPDAGRTRVLDAAAYCVELRRPVQRLKDIGAGDAVLPLFRAPAGRTSPRLLAAARACGFEHVGWSRAGFLGDELPSDRYPNAQLLEQALRDIRAGDILVAHLGIWSRQEPWAPAVLEPLVQGLQQRGLCFATLREHPVYGRRPARP